MDSRPHSQLQYSDPSLSTIQKSDLVCVSVFVCLKCIYKPLTSPLTRGVVCRDTAVSPLPPSLSFDLVLLKVSKEKR